MPEFLDTASGRRIAYVKTDGTGPGVVFLGGFMSDMSGTKAIWLEDWAKAQGRAYLRLDYSGHGASSGAFTDGCIGDWAADAEAAIRALTQGPQILVGSSMGGWISLVLARRMPEKLAGLVGIAAAPDFTEDGYWAKFSAAERQTIMTEGQIEVPTDYEAPYIITRRLIEDGRYHLVLTKPLKLPFPARFLQGTMDEAVDQSVPLKILQHVDCDDMQLTLVKGVDHRFSEPECLTMIGAALDQVIAAGSA